MQAKLARRSGDSTRAESFLRDLLAMPDSDHHWEASYALGAILDKEGNYDGAMEALVEGKQWHRGRAPTKLARAQAENVLARNQRLMETITPDHFQRCNGCLCTFRSDGRWQPINPLPCNALPRPEGWWRAATPEHRV